MASLCYHRGMKQPSDTTPIAERVSKFFAKYPLQTFDKRQLLLRPDAELPGVFYLADGRVSQYDVTPSGSEVVVNVFKPGTFFPMSAAINQTPNHYFFEASTAISVHVAPVADVVQFLHDEPGVTFDLLSRVYRGVDGVLRRMAHLMGGDAKTRLLFELLNTAHRFGEPGSDGSVTLVLTESELARYSGLTRETVSRTLRAFKSSGLVRVGNGRITLSSTQAIETALGNGL